MPLYRLNIKKGHIIDTFTKVSLSSLIKHLSLQNSNYFGNAGTLDEDYIYVVIFVSIKIRKVTKNQ